MGFFKNIWDAAGKFGSGDDNGVLDASKDKLLNDGPNAWKKAANAWRENGVWASNYDDPSLATDASETIIPSDDRTLVNSRADIIVVIDPGHGLGSDNVGASLIKGYKYKVQDGTTGKVKTETVEGKEVEVTDEKDIGSLPQYVVDDIKTATFNETTGKAIKSNWVIKATYWPYNDGSKVKTKAEKEAAELTNKLERVLVWQVAQELIGILNTIGYTVKTTRESVLDGMLTSARMAKIHGFNPDYLISLHCDGKTNYTVSGAHAEYRVGKKGKDFVTEQMDFSDDIITAYGEANVVNVLNPSIRRVPDIGVLTPIDSPKLIRKILLELGFGSNPADYNAIYNNRHEIARHIAMGVENNAIRNFGVLSNEIIGFQTTGGRTVLYKVPQDPSNGIGKSKNNEVYRVDDLPPTPPF